MIEIVVDGLSIKQYGRLLEIVGQSGEFALERKGYISPSKILENHPKGEGNTVLPVGLITDNRAILLSVDKTFPEDYHAMLRKLYEQVRDI